MYKMRDDLIDMVEILESLLDDSPHKVKVELQTTISMLKKAETSEDLINVQEQLEYVANINNIDAFISTEVYNAISILETLM